MNEKQARRLWNQLCSPCGEYSHITTALGVVATSHGLSDSIRTAPNTITVQTDPEVIQEIKAVATFLRTWADLIDVKFEVTEEPNEQADSEA